MISPVLAPPLPAGLLGLPREGGVVLSDQWVGYTADRNRLLRALRDNHVRDTVFLTGDIHSSWACDVPLDAALYPWLSPSLAAEFVCTSVTSDNIDDLLSVPPRTVSPTIESAITTLNRHVKWGELDSHGASVPEGDADRGPDGLVPPARPDQPHEWGPVRPLLSDPHRYPTRRARRHPHRPLTPPPPGSRGVPRRLRHIAGRPHAGLARLTRIT